MEEKGASCDVGGQQAEPGRGVQVGEVARDCVGGKTARDGQLRRRSGRRRDLHITESKEKKSVNGALNNLLQRKNKTKQNNN